MALPYFLVPGPFKKREAPFTYMYVVPFLGGVGSARLCLNVTTETNLTFITTSKHRWNYTCLTWHAVPAAWMFSTELVVYLCSCYRQWRGVCLMRSPKKGGLTSRCLALW